MTSSASDPPTDPFESTPCNPAPQSDDPPDWPANVPKGWSENTPFAEVTATTPDGQPTLIPLSDYTPLLETLCRRLRDLVEDSCGGQVDWQILEGHMERTLLFQYQVKGVSGATRVRMTPPADR